jgi:solute carrier family 25 S-adenosylmethionine transporter 26
MKLVAVALSAAIGNTFASVVRAPLEVIKQRVQAGQYPSALQAIQSCIKEEGILSVWGGGKLTSQLIRDIPYAVFTLMSYEFLQILVTRTLRRRAQLARLQRQEKQSSASTIERPEHATPVADILYRSFTEEKFRNAICGALAGGFGSFMTNPMDLMKTRVMTSKAYDSVTAAAFSILKNEGILTFFVGVGPRLLHKIPANGLFFLCYESFRSILGVKSTSNE